MEAATRDYQGQTLTGNGLVRSEREAANEGTPESSAAVNAICHLIREQDLWPEDVVALVNAISGTLAGGMRKGREFEQRMVEELDQLSDSINAVLSGEAEVL